MRAQAFYTAEECLSLAEKFATLAQMERDDAVHMVRQGFTDTARLLLDRAQVNEDKALKWSKLAEERRAA